MFKLVVFEWFDKEQLHYTKEYDNVPLSEFFRLMDWKARHLKDEGLVIHQVVIVPQEE